MAVHMTITDAAYVVLVGNDRGASVPVLLTNYGPDRLGVFVDELSFEPMLDPGTSRIYVCTGGTLKVAPFTDAAARGTAEFSIG